MHKWHVYPKFDDASKAAADFIADIIERKLQQRGICHVILPGGNTPAICLAYLAEKKLSCRAAWDIAHRFKVPKMAVSAACEALNIKIKPCQLGAF